MLTVEVARELAARWRPQFVDEASFESSWSRYFETATVPDEQRLESWLVKDQAKDAVKHAGIVHEPTVPISSTYMLPEARLNAAIIAGDIHDFRDPLLPPDNHAAICPRCQLGIRSRARANDFARSRGKKPFPGFSDMLKTFETNAQRCQDCGGSEDDPSPDDCPQAFWHLPDIFCAIHPGAGLVDMGQIGPFMRGFLRRQRQP